MADLRTKFMGIEIKNPVIVGASNLSMNPEILLQLQEAGAAAIVYKSLFEEQIQYEKMQMDDSLHEFDDRNAEMTTIFPHIEHAGPKEYLLSLKKAKESLSIPLIGSLNAIYKESWVEYAELIAGTGVDGLELNFYSVPKDSSKTAEQIENSIVEIVAEIKKVVKIPVGIKLGPYFTNPLNLIAKLEKIGVEGYVLFNRLFQPDIDVDNEEHRYPFNLSKEGDYRLSLRYAGLLYNNTLGNITANTGVYTGKDVARLILAGADSVQVVSAIYKHKPTHLNHIIAELEDWMNSKNYNSISDFQGKLSKASSDDPFAYSRAQYVDILMRPEELIKKYPVV